MRKSSILRVIRISKPAAFPLAFLASAFALSAAGFVPSTAQSPEQEEREIEDISPKHLPITIKVKDVGKIKDLKNEKWAHDLEVEVKNIGAKPVYFISLSLSMPEVKAPDGTEIGYIFHYGRINLIDYTVKPVPEDTPLLPGATHTFRLPERYLENWELAKAEYPKPKKLKFRINYINFGDGTGFLGDGTLLGGDKKVSSNCSNGSSPRAIGRPGPRFRMG